MSLPLASTNLQHERTGHHIGSMTQMASAKPKLLQAILEASRTVQRLLTHAFETKGTRRLQISQTLSLGDKRSLHIVNIDGTEYLIGCGTTTVSLLTRLSQKGTLPAFEQAMQEAWQDGPAA